MRRTLLLPLFFLSVHLFGDAFSFPSNPNLYCPRDLFFYADGLLLQAKEDGLEFAIQSADFTQQSIQNGKVEGFSSGHSDYGYNPGVRVGMGFLFREDRWNFDLAWTCLKITQYKKASAKPTSILYPLWLITSSVNGTNQTANAVWDVNYNLLDLNLGKSYCVSRALVLNPHIGGRAAFIDQHYSIHYGGIFGSNIGAISHNDNDCAAFGIRAGIDTEWRLGKDWALFGKAAAALLWSKILTAQQSDAGNNNGYDIKEKLNQNIPNLELALGLLWGRSFHRDQFHLNAKLGYEFSEWWDMNQLRQFSGGSIGFPNDTVSRGNLTLNGFSLRLQIDI